MIEYMKMRSCSPVSVGFLSKELLIFPNKSSHCCILVKFGFSSKILITGAIRSKKEPVKSMYCVKTSNIGKAFLAFDSFMCFFLVS